MHPMFVKLFLEPDADDLLADEEGAAAPRQPGQAQPVTHDREGHRPRPGSPAATLTLAARQGGAKRRADQPGGAGPNSDHARYW